MPCAIWFLPTPTAKRQLEGIIHPLVALVLQEQAQTAIEQGKTCLVYDVPLLVEGIARWRSQVDKICVVDSLPRPKFKGSWQRSAANLAALKLNASCLNRPTREQRLACADVVILNEGLDLLQLRAKVHEMWASFGL
jgi:dephospho-CoA kinase